MEIRYSRWVLAGRPVGDQFSFYKQQRLLDLGLRFECSGILLSAIWLNPLTAV